LDPPKPRRKSGGQQNDGSGNASSTSSSGDGDEPVSVVEVVQVHRDAEKDVSQDGGLHKSCCGYLLIGM